MSVRPLCTLQARYRCPVWGRRNTAEDLGMMQTSSKNTRRLSCCSTFPQEGKQQCRHSQDLQGKGELHSILQQIPVADSGQLQAQGRKAGCREETSSKSKESKRHLRMLRNYNKLVSKVHILCVYCIQHFVFCFCLCRQRAVFTACEQPILITKRHERL